MPASWSSIRRFLFGQQTARSRKLKRRASHRSAAYAAEQLEGRTLLSAIVVSGLNDGQVVTAGTNVTLNVSGIEAGGDLFFACAGIHLAVQVGGTQIQAPVQLFNTPFTAGSFGFATTTTPIPAIGGAPNLFEELVQTGQAGSGTTGNENGTWVLPFRSDLTNEFTRTLEDANLNPDPNGAFSVGPTLIIGYIDPQGNKSTYVAEFQFKAATPPGNLKFQAQPQKQADANAILDPISVAIKDSGGSVQTGDSTSNITLTLQGDPASAMLNGTTTEQVSNGVATFSDLSVSAAGTYTLAATDDNGDAMAVSSSFKIAAPKLTVGPHLVFTSKLPNTSAFSTLNPPVSVAVEDSKKHVIVADNSIITLTLEPQANAMGTLSGVTTIQAQNGVAVFPGLSIDQAGSYMLKSTQVGVVDGQSKVFKITPPRLKFVALATTRVNHPINSPPTAGSPVGFKVEVDGSNGKILPTDNESRITVTMVSGPGGATLTGNNTFTVAGGLTPAFLLTPDKPGKYVLRATDQFNNVGKSKPVEVTGLKLSLPGKGSKLANTAVNSPLQLVAENDVKVSALYAPPFPTVPSDDSTPIIVELQKIQGSGTLGGTSSEPTSVGVAIFSDLTINAPGKYRLLFMTPAGTNVLRSNVFTVK